MKIPGLLVPLAGMVCAGAGASAQQLPPSRGEVVERVVPRAGEPAGRRVWVYTPSGYPASCGHACALVVSFDGSEYLHTIPLPAILDSLASAGAIPPTVALLIENGSSARRIADLGNRAGFAAWVSDGVLPWLRAHWQVTADPGRTVITGSSAGGLAAAYLAFRRPDLFGNVLSQSGAFWRGNEGSNAPPYQWLTAQYVTAPRRPIRFLLEVGSTESHGAMSGAAPSILEANRHLRDMLVGKGYEVTYYEVPGGAHDPASWRRRLPAGLAKLLSEAR